jgi:hypothetical protein
MIFIEIFFKFKIKSFYFEFLNFLLYLFFEKKFLFKIISDLIKLLKIIKKMIIIEKNISQDKII